MKLEIVKKNPVDSSEKLYAVLTLFLMTRPLWQLMIVRGVDVQFLMVVGLYCVALRLVLNKPNRFVWIGSRDKLLLFLICLVLLSTVWSVNSSSTIKNSVTLLGGTFFGIYLAMRYSLREQMQVFAWTLGIVAVLSLIVAVAFPAVGTQTAGGYTVWAGIYDHKNGLGRYMAISAILSWILMMDSKKKWLLWGNFLFAIGLILMARSATSLLAVIVTMCLLPIYRVWRWRNARALPGIVIIGLLAASIGIIILITSHDVNLDLFFSALGRNPDNNTLQVRSALWDIVVEKAKQRPWLGYGYGDAWIYTEGSGNLVWYGNIWEYKQAHNGFLEILLQLGLVGLVAMVYHILLGFHRGIKLARLTKTKEALWVLAYLTTLLLFNLTYSVYLGQLTVPWTIYVALTLSMCFQLARIKIVSVSRAIDKSVST